MILFGKCSFNWKGNYLIKIGFTCISKIILKPLRSALFIIPLKYHLPSAKYDMIILHVLFATFCT